MPISGWPIFNASKLIKPTSLYTEIDIANCAIQWLRPYTSYLGIKKVI